MTFQLLTNSEGKKMGKTEKGAVWLDPEKTSPYEFYQYWRNVGDKDVEKCLRLLTFLPMDEVKRLGALEGSEINKAKEVLAYELTKIVHGEEEAKKADKAAKALFMGGSEGGSIPTTEVKAADLENMDILGALVLTGLTPSRSEARRAVQQGGVKLNDEKVDDIAFKITEDVFKDGIITIQRGKKSFHRLKLV